MSVYSLVRQAKARAAALALLLCVSVGGPAVAQPPREDLVRVFDGEPLRDPTRPAGATLPEQDAGDNGGSVTGNHAPGGRQYRVSFIRAGGSRPMAVINDQPVGVGEEIGGARVLAIEAGVVTLEVNGERRTFATWRGEAVRQPGSGAATGTDTMNRERETDN